MPPLALPQLGLVMNNFSPSPNQSVIQKIINSAWYIKLSIFAFVILFLSLIFQLFTPPLKEIPATELYTRNIDSSLSKMDNVLYKGQAITLPENLPYAKATSLAYDINLIIDRLKDKYQLKPHSDVSGLYLGEEYTLNINPSDNFYQLTKDKNALVENGQILDQKTATEKATEFLGKTIPQLEFKVNESEIKYYLAGLHLERTNDINKASVIELPFSQTIAGLPIFLNKKSYYPIIIQMNKNYEIIRFIFTDFFYNYQVVGNLKSLSTLEAENNINSGKASIIKSTTETIYEGLNISEIKEGVLTSALVEYRHDPAIDYIYPVYRFFGKVKNKDNIEIQVEIITPAVIIKE